MVGGTNYRNGWRFSGVLFSKIWAPLAHSAVRTKQQAGWQSEHKILSVFLKIDLLNPGRIHFSPNIAKELSWLQKIQAWFSTKILLLYRLSTFLPIFYFSTDFLLFYWFSTFLQMFYMPTDFLLFNYFSTKFIIFYWFSTFLPVVQVVILTQVDQLVLWTQVDQVVLLA